MFRKAPVMRFSRWESNVGGIPGLYLFHDFAGGPEDLVKMEHQAVALRERIRVAVRDCSQSSVPPASNFIHLSEHKVEARSPFLSISVPATDGSSNVPATVRGQHFVDFGDQGHCFTYFQNKDLPDLGHALIERFPVDLVFPHGATGWTLILNSYDVRVESNKRHRGGFPFHIDVPANGDVTGIMSLLDGGDLEFAKPVTEGEKVAMPVRTDGDAHKKKLRSIKERIVDDASRVMVHVARGDLLLLSGESRYQWAHRVVPTDNANDVRLSAVLGCRSAKATVGRAKEE